MYRYCCSYGFIASIIVFNDLEMDACDIDMSFGLKMGINDVWSKLSMYVLAMIL